VTAPSSPEATRQAHRDMVEALLSGEPDRAERVARESIREGLRIIEEELVVGGQNLTLPLHRFAWAESPGDLTIDLPTGGRHLWVNTDDDLRVEALGPRGEPIARGSTTGRRCRGVYRAVAWDRPAQSGSKVRITLPAGAKVFAVITSNSQDRIE
jgi:hypothetical protein